MSDGLEVVLFEIMGDFFAQHGSLRVGSAEVYACPDPGVDDLLERLREAVEAARSAGFVAEGAEADFVGAEEVLERVHECTGRASVSRGMLGERWRDQQRRIADGCPRVE